MPRNARLDIPGVLQHLIVRGREKRDIFLDDEDMELFLKRIFGRNKKIALQEYREFIADGFLQGHRHELTGGGLKRSQGGMIGMDELESFDERILGGGEFVDHLLRQEELRSRFVKTLTLPDLLEMVGSIWSLLPADICRPSKKQALTEARGVICYIAVRGLLYKGRKLAKSSI